MWKTQLTQNKREQNNKTDEENNENRMNGISLWAIYCEVSCVSGALSLKPRPNDRNMSQHCWAQHVACVWPPCCDMLGVVGSSLKMVKFEPKHPTSRSISQHGGQTHVTCCAQQCCDMLRWHVAIVWPGLKRWKYHSFHSDQSWKLWWTIRGRYEVFQFGKLFYNVSGRDKIHRKHLKYRK